MSFNQNDHKIGRDQYNAGNDININRPIEYEYRDISLPWMILGGPIIHIKDAVGHGRSIEEAKELSWQAGRSEILRELSLWFDDGWEPVGQIGSAGINLLITDSPIPRLPGAVLSDTVATPTSYSILLRRPKNI